MTNFSGLWVPLVTPFQNGEVDYAAAQKLASHMIDKGVDGLVACGTTGEATSLNSFEKTLLIEAVMGAAYGRCPVLMGLSGSDTHTVASEARAFAPTGIDGYLISPPCYVRPSQAGIIEHFRHIAKATYLPIVIYNIPARTGVHMEIPTIAALCESKQFVAIKECSGLEQLTTLTKNSYCNLLCGEDAALFKALTLGAQGAISASAQIFPELFVKMYQLAREGKIIQAERLFKRLLPLIQALFSEPNPAPIKAAMAMQGHIRNELRLPMLPASDGCKDTLRAILSDLETEASQATSVKGVKAHAA